jgi:hypothetical protein
MRIGALLLVGIGLLAAAACSANTSSNLVCESAGGTCLSIEGGMEGCGEQLSGSTCDLGYVCCTLGTTPSPAGQDAAYPTSSEGGSTVKAADASTGG